jgi:hypothetical protein
MVNSSGERLAAAIENGCGGKGAKRKGEKRAKRETKKRETKRDRLI